MTAGHAVSARVLGGIQQIIGLLKRGWAIGYQAARQSDLAVQSVWPRGMEAFGQQVGQLGVNGLYKGLDWRLRSLKPHRKFLAAHAVAMCGSKVTALQMECR